MKQSATGGATATLAPIADESTEAHDGGPVVAAPAAARPADAAGAEAAQSPAQRKLAQILRIKVPVIVQLAQRRSAIGYVRRLTLGMIIEFSKQVDEMLELRINNRTVGRGEAVKVGEQLGLRISEIREPAERVRTLGR